MDYRLMITDLRCHYRKAVRYDDMISIRTRVKDLRGRVVSLCYQILSRETEEVVAEGETRHLYLDSAGRARAIPDAFHSSLQ